MAQIDVPAGTTPVADEAVSEAEQLSILQLLIAQAQAQIDLQSQQSDSHDTKAFGYVAAEVAAVGVIVIVPGPQHPVWALPVVALLASVFFFTQALKNREFALGPDLPEFYQKWGGATAVEVHRHMLAQLFFASAVNERLVVAKQWWYKNGIRALVLGALLTALLALIQAG